MIVSAVVAMNSKLLIGKNNDLPWKLKDDLEHFKDYTLNKPIIMGRKTFESIGRPLPNRFNIVISSQDGTEEEISYTRSIHDALDISKDFCGSTGQNEAVLIGGSRVFEEGFNFLDKLVITWVKADKLEGDVYFPKFDLSKWNEISSKNYSSSDINEYDFSIKEYLKVKNL